MMTTLLYEVAPRTPGVGGRHSSAGGGGGGRGTAAGAPCGADRSADRVTARLTLVGFVSYSESDYPVLLVFNLGKELCYPKECAEIPRSDGCNVTLFCKKSFWTLE